MKTLYLTFAAFLVSLFVAFMAWMHRTRGRAYAVTPPGPSTGALGAAIPVTGLLLQVSNTSSSPNSFYTVANVSEFNFPLGAKTVDQTNVSMTWESMIPTLLTYGKVTMKIFWVMEDPTHMNSAGGGSAPTGLRYLYVNKLLRQWLIEYPEGGNPVDTFQAYVTGFAIDGKVADVFHATIELTVNDQNPGLV